MDNVDEMILDNVLQMSKNQRKQLSKVIKGPGFKRQTSHANPYPRMDQLCAFDSYGRKYGLIK
jgi:hypothetical protein